MFASHNAQTGAVNTLQEKAKIQEINTESGEKMTSNL